MTSKIRVLSDHTINKIAAGEVIENPASVVKELVENSLDADSNEICIEIRGGGRQLIRISDNGYGMGPDDALLCLERHATSKIRSVEEIHYVNTMGFRGEAIPSIASISKFTILTQERGSPNDCLGTLVIVDGGTLISCSRAASSSGTVMEVKSLFFNVPVRKKFLKSPANDANEILKIVLTIALGYPETLFRLINDGKTQLNTSPILEKEFPEKLKHRIGEVLGQDYINHTCYISEEKEGYKVDGYIGLPDYTRHNRSGQYLFINQRAVTSPLVSFAVKDGYGTTIATGRHPVFVLHLTIPGGMVDVNVHPQKREVRLRQDFGLRQLIISAISKALQKNYHHHIAHELPWMRFTDENITNHYLVDSPIEDHFKTTLNSTSGEKIPATWQMRSQELITSKHLTPLVTPQYPSQPLFHVELEPKQKAPAIIGTIPHYIIVEGNIDTGGLLIIEQRSAHTRILYEKLLRQSETIPMASQILLIPYSLDVNSADAERLRSSIPTLNRLGIHLKEFGPRTFIVDAIPQFFGETDLKSFLDDLVHDLKGFDDHQLFNKQIALAASKAAIGRDRQLPLQEAKSLLDQLFCCKQPNYCPFGKLIIAHLTNEHLDKLFQPKKP